MVLMLGRGDREIVDVVLDYPSLVGTYEKPQTHSQESFLGASGL